MARVFVALAMSASSACGGKSSDADVACSSIAQGCACEEGATAECGELASVAADSITCSRGVRTCSRSRWGACVGKSLAFQSLATGGSGTALHPKGLGTAATCTDNPCDPECKRFVDDAVGLDAGGALVSGEAGVSIAPTDAAGVPDGAACSNLQCRIDSCGGNPNATTISGTVFDPAGYNPIYNAVVYVPNAALAPIAEGVTCDKCVAGSGSPIVTATTGADGTFVLKGVPSGADVPLVVQIGKWRREAVIPFVNRCVDNPLPTANGTSGQRTALVTRLPRNKTEGHIPQMAVATGSADPFECLLLKMGLDASEFTTPADPGKGRVHYYVNRHSGNDGVDLSPGGAPEASALWGSTSVLRNYDIVFLPCEGSEYARAAPAPQNLIDYTSGGGRLFTTHYSYVWMQFAPAPFSSVATWDHRYAFSVDNPVRATIDQTFGKGAAFAQWLGYVGASPASGKLDLYEARWDAVSVNPSIARTWMSATSTSPPGSYVFYQPNEWSWCTTAEDCGAGNYSCTGGRCYGATCSVDSDCVSGQACWSNGSFKECVQRMVVGADNVRPHFTFNTPIGAAPDAQCGRVVYSDFHVSVSALSGAPRFPASCAVGPLSSQEKALEFMVFDLSSCISPDTPPPAPAAPPYPASVPYVREYQSTCPIGTKVVWRFFDFQTLTPSGTSITFSARTSQTLSGLDAAPSVTLATVSGPPITSWLGVDVGAALASLPPVSSPLVASRDFLRVTAMLNPSPDMMYTPTLTAWRQTFDCVPME